MDFDFGNFVIGSNILPKFLTLWRNSFPRSAEETKTERGCGDAGSWEATLEAGALASMSILALRWSNGDSRIEIHVTDTGSAQKITMSNNSSNGSENSEGYIREEPKENLEDVNYNGCASGDETIEDQVEHSRLQDGQQPNSQSVSDDEEDMVKLDNNDLNYDDYDDYEGEARERVESNNSSVHLQHSEDLKENEMVGVSDSEGEDADDVQKADQKSEKTAVNNDFEENEAGELPEDDDGIEKQKEIKNKKECEELEEGEIEDEDDEEEIEEV
uniref:Uncharacterized protein n=1 Tax=Meloidogyne floridensis TaxID=298350 RepID=A0A915NMG9_9BILA